MDGPALPWFQSLHNNFQLTTWQRFTEILMDRFGPSPYRVSPPPSPPYTPPLPSYTPPATTYNRPPLILPKPPQEPKPLQPPFLLVATNLAEELEDTIESQEKLMEDRSADLPTQPPVLPYLISSPPSPTYTPPPSTYTPPAIPYSPPPQTLTYNWPTLDPRAPQSPQLPLLEPRPSSVPLYQLPPSQMAERKAKGQCFTYDDMFQRGHICKAKLFLLGATNEDYDEPGIATSIRDSEPIDYS